MKISVGIFCVLCMIAVPVIGLCATVSGQVTCSGSPNPTFILVMALDIESGQNLGYVLADGSGNYEYSGLPDNTDLMIVVLPSSGRIESGYEVHEYVIQTKAINTGTGVTDLDFVTAPGYQLIFTGKKDGAPITDSDLKEFFVTDLNDKAYPLVNVGSTKVDSKYAVPSTILPLGESYAIHFQWTLPHAGRIMITVDNSGSGYSSTTQSAVIIDANHAIAASALKQLENDLAKTAASDDDRQKAQDVIAQVNNLISQEDYDEAAGLAIVAAENLAIASAKVGIENYRKGDLTVLVLDGNGDPVPEADITIAQQSRDFLFGFFDQYEDLGDAGSSQLKDDGFNYFTAGVYWNESEPQDNAYDWDLLDNIVGIPPMADLGFDVKAHPLIWMLDLAMPEYLLAMNETQMAAEVHDHISAIVSRYASQIDRWEVINEAHGFPASGNFDRDFITELTRDSVDLVHALDPGSVATVNAAFAWYGSDVLAEIYEVDHDQRFSMPVFNYFKDLIDQGIDFDVIGQQMYNGGCITLFYEYGLGDPAPVPTYDIATLSRILGKLGTLGKPIHLTEQSVPSSMCDMCPDQGYWRAPWSEQQQADFIEAFYTIVFGQQSMEAMTWWDMHDEDSFINTGGLHDENGSPKPGYERIKQLLASWQTNTEGQTGSDGTFKLRAFGGEHEITATLSNHTASATEHIYEQSDKTVTLILEDYFPEDEDPNSGQDDDDDNDEGCGC